MVKVKKRGSDVKYLATVLAVGTECDIGEHQIVWRYHYLAMAASLTNKTHSIKTTNCHAFAPPVLFLSASAMLSVEDEGFWKDVTPLDFGPLPRLQDSVTVVGYPIGGDSISVTSGVVSRIEVTLYSHGASELLGVQVFTHLPAFSSPALFLAVVSLLEGQVFEQGCGFACLRLTMPSTLAIQGRLRSTHRASVLGLLSSL